MTPSRHARRVNVRRRRRLVGAALALVVLSTAAFLRYGLATTSVVTTSTSAPSTTTSSTTTTTLAPVHAVVGTLFLTFHEPATGTLAARTLPAIVRYPASGTGSFDVAGAPALRAHGPYPLVIFSQGFDISPEAYYLLLNAWAAAGFVVVDPAYPYTSPGAPGGVVRTDIVHHPHDLSFVLTSLLAESAAPTGILSGLINPAEVAVIGQSDGGDVSLAAVANTCCLDPRIKAAVILSGAELSWFPGRYFSTPTVPMLVVQGSNDHVMNPVPCSVTLYNSASEPKYYLSMIGQTHLSAYVPAGEPERIVTRATIDFLDGYLKHQDSRRHALNAAGTVPGYATITSRFYLGAPSGSCPQAPTG